MSDRPEPTRVFLDAGVLIAAVISPDGGASKLWGLDSLTLVTSGYALQEAWLNLKNFPDHEKHFQRLEALVGMIEVRAEPADPSLARDWKLRDPGDIEILCGALDAKCAVLLTLDSECFGPYFGKTIDGLTVLKPGKFLDRLGL